MANFISNSAILRLMHSERLLTMAPWGELEHAKMADFRYKSAIMIFP